MPANAVTNDLTITNGDSITLDKDSNYTAWNLWNGSLSVTGGVHNSGSTMKVGDFRSGKYKDAVGILNISGSGTIVNYDGMNYIGLTGGTGYLNITDGAVLRSNYDGEPQGANHAFMIGYGGEAYVTISGKGSLLDVRRQQFALGANGGFKVVVRIINGGTIDATERTGSMSIYNGSVIIDGLGSRFLSSAYDLRGGNITVSNNGDISGDYINIAFGRKDGALIDGALIIGAAEGEKPVAAGIVNVNKIYFDSNNTGTTESMLILNHTDDNFHLRSDLSGVGSEGIISALNGVSWLDGNNSGYAGALNIDTPAKVIVSTQNNLGNSVITDDGELRLQGNADWSFINDISGAGILTADTGGHHFSFDTNKPGTTFTGTVNLENTLFDLDGVNTEALAQSTLLLGDKSITTVGSGTQTFGGLAFNGGTLNFGEVAPGDTISDRFVETTKDLNLTGKGQIQITDGVDFENTPQHPDTTRPLLQQDEDGVMVQLAGSQGTVTGSGGNLSLIDQNGNAISSGVVSHITQNGETVANGTYDYRLTSGDNHDGLYINYGLTEVELLAQGDNALTLSAEGNTGNAADLSAKVTGSGDLHINTDTDLSLSNSENDYTGITDVIAGTLKMGNNNVLGATRLLNLNAGTRLDMNGYAQTLQNLNTEAGSSLDFNQGALTVNNGSVAGNLTGAGSLIVTGGTLVVSSDNADMSADTTIASDGVVRMLAGQALGTGSVDNKGVLFLGQDETASVRARVAQPTAYQTGNLTNSGTVVLGHNDASGAAVAGTTLTVNGNYNGNDGHLRFNTVLGNDDSTTDKMVVTGDTSGTTGVSVTNAGGSGDKTLNGIELIEVAGQSDGNFSQEGRIVAGAYDYSLVRGQGDNSGNWYLTSQISEPPVKPVDPPVNPPVEPTDPVLPPSGGEHVDRPEGGSYIANLMAANTLFNTRLHDRLGETQYVDALTGEKKVTSLWLRQVGSHNDWRDSSGQLKTQSNGYVAQIGGDIAQWSSDGLNRGHVGVMTGYANSHSNTHSSVTGYDSKGSVNGYSVGVYGTWFANEEDKSGLYVDSWVQYSWFNNHVNGEQLAGERYRSKGVTGSVETGYTVKMGEFTGSQGTLNEWFIQPQAQATWMGVKADKHREDNGTNVTSEGDGNLQTRLGVRAYIKGHHAMDNDKTRTFEPFIEANWLHNTRGYSAKMDDVRISQAGARNLGEVKVGVEGQINAQLNLWGNIGTQMGDKGYNDSAAMIGMKYNF